MGDWTVTDFMRDREIVNFKLPRLDAPNTEELARLLSDKSTRWYALKKLAKFEKLGLTAGAKWNPLLHPRGPDGKFIEKFGWVRFLLNGRWVRGFVEDIDDEGVLRVRDVETGNAHFFSNFEASKKLYSLPKPKARLNLPDLGASDGNWKVTGPQGGSNPGGKFGLVTPEEHTLHITGRELFDGTDGVFPAPSKWGGSESPTAIPGTRRGLRDFKEYQSLTAVAKMQKLPKDGSFIIIPMSGDSAATMTYRVLMVVRNDGSQSSWYDDPPSKYDVIDVLTGENFGAFGSDEMKAAFAKMQTQRSDLARKAKVRIVHPDVISGGLLTDLGAFHAIARAAGVLRNAVESAPAEGADVYVKKLKTPDHVKNEVLANRLYELAGVPRPEVHFGTDPRTIGSVFLTGDTFQSLSDVLDGPNGDPDIVAEIRENFVVDAWLANWDVAGLTYDNIVVVDGVATRIDSGGSLLYRAQGSPKGSAFGGKVTELESLRDKSVNAQSARVFAGITTEELQAGARKVAGIHPDTIKEYVEAHGLDDSLALTLIARRAYIIDTVLDGQDPYSPDFKNVDKTGLENFSDEYLLEAATTLINYAVGEDSKVDLGEMLPIELERRGLLDKVAEAEKKAKELKAAGTDPLIPSVVADTPTVTDLDIEEKVKVATADTSLRWLWDEKSGVWYRADKDPEEWLANAAAELSQTILGMQQFEGKSVAEVISRENMTSTDEMFDAQGVKPEFVGRRILVGGRLLEVVGSGELAESLVKDHLSSPTIRMKDVVTDEVIDIPRSDFIAAHQKLSSSYSNSSDSDVTTAVDTVTLGLLLDPDETDKELLDAVVAEARQAYVNAMLDGGWEPDSTLPQYFIGSDAYRRPGKFNEDGTPVASTDGQLWVYATTTLGGAQFHAFDFLLANTYHSYSNYSGGYTGQVQPRELVVAVPERKAAPSIIYSSVTDGYYSQLKKYSLFDGDDGKESFGSLKAVKSLPAGARVSITPRTSWSSGGQEDIWEVTEDGKLRLVGFGNHTVDTLYEAQEAGTLGVETGSPHKAYVNIPKGVKIVKDNKGYRVEGDFIVDIEDIDLSSSAGDLLPRVREVNVEKSTQSAALRRARQERTRLIKDAEEALDAAISIAVTQQPPSIASKEVFGSSEVPEAVRLVGEKARIPKVGDPLGGSTEQPSFNPDDSGVSFIGILDGTQVEPGMWVILNPSSRYSSNARKPVRVTEVNTKEVDGVTILESLKFETISGREMEVVGYKYGDITWESVVGKLVEMELTDEDGSSYKADVALATSARIVRISPPGIPSAPPTLKKDGTVVVDGMQVGTWTNDWSYGRKVTLDRKFTATGEPLELFGAASSIRKLVRDWVVIPPAQAHAVAEKSAKAKAKKAAIVWKTGKLSDGSKVEAGMKVRYVVDGAEGVLVGSVHPSRNDYVFVKFDDGRIDVVDTVALVNIDGPSEPVVKVDVPVGDLPETVIEAMAKTPEKYVTADGNKPVIGMKVESGKSGKVIVGYITAINDAGYIKVKDESTGKVVWRSIKVTKVIEAPGGGDIVPVAATAATLKTGEVKPDLQLAGVEVLQSPDKIAAYVEHGGVLTFDGYIPEVGLPVIDRSGTRFIIAKRQPNKNAVLVYDPEEPEKLKSRTVDMLTLDVASYNGDHGHIDNITFVFNGTVLEIGTSVPNGSSIYYVKNVSTATQRGLSHIIAVSPEGKVWRSSVGWDGKPKWQVYHTSAEDFFKGSYVGGNIQKLGVLVSTDDDQGAHLVFQPPTSKVSPILIVEDASKELDVVKVIAEKKQELAPKILTESGKVEPLKSFEGTIESGDVPGGTFPEPPNVKKKSKKTVAGSAPVITGGKADLTSKPAGMEGNAKVLSVVEAAESVVSNTKNPTANGGVRYALMDERLVEDTLVRFQVVQAPDGTRYVEARFRLQEEASEALADQMFVSSSTKFGGWSMRGLVYPNELVEGDHISVSYSEEYGVLRPSTNSDIANARIVSAPVLVGTSTRGSFPVYRAQVLLHTGEYAYIDLEQRDGASIAVIDWDPDLVISTSSGSWALSEGANLAGWEQVAGVIGSAYPGGIHVDENGVAHLSASTEAGSNLSLSGQGVTVRRTLPNGTVVKFSGVASKHGTTTESQPRRHEMARDVRIRIPLEGEDIDSEVFTSAMSQALEAVGIPPESQTPPDADQLARLAINKFNKQFSSTFSHREKLDESIDVLSADNDTIKQALQKASSRIGLTGDDRITLKDIEYVVMDDGRVFPVVSERVAEAVTKKQGVRFFTHGLSGGVAQLIEILGGMTSSGLFGADERWSIGIATSGMSTSADARIGSGDRVYLRGRTSTTLGGSIVLSPIAVNRTLDGYFNNGDRFGRRSEQNMMVTATPTNDGNEYMIKRKFDATQIGYILISSGDRDTLIEELKKRGVTSIGGRAIEDIVVVKGTAKADDKFTSLGTDLDVILTVDDLLNLGETTDAAAGAEAAAAGGVV